MILGYEAPVDIPVMSIYDKDAMKSYLAALKDDYDQTKKEWKEFQDKYGDFYSMIPGATEAYYEAGVGQAMDSIKRFQEATGVDPMRSIQGRAMVEQAIRNANRPLMNTIKQSAENRELYEKAKAKMMADGTYDKDFEDARLRQLGIDPYKWNNNILWDQLSPMAYKDPASYWTDILKVIPSREHMYDKDGNETDKAAEAQTRRVEVTPKDVEEAIAAQYDQYMRTPHYIYTRDNLAEQIKEADPRMSEDAARARADKEIKESIINMGVRSGKTELDPVYRMNQDQKNEKELISLRAHSSGSGGGGGSRHSGGYGSHGGHSGSGSGDYIYPYYQGSDKYRIGNYDNSIGGWMCDWEAASSMLYAKTNRHFSKNLKGRNFIVQPEGQPFTRDGKHYINVVIYHSGRTKNDPTPYGNDHGTMRITYGKQVKIGGK